MILKLMKLNNMVDISDVHINDSGQTLFFDSNGSLSCCLTIIYASKVVIQSLNKHRDLVFPDLYNPLKNE